MLDIDRLTARIIELGEQMADLDAAASLLEEMKKPVLAQEMLKHVGMSNAAAETQALASANYIDHVRRMVEARKEAIKAKVRWEQGKNHCDLIRTLEASKRAEMGLAR